MSRWILNRLGALNYWYYTNQVFETGNGRLMFKGNNGAGKSLTMQSFLPVLLDGNSSPQRLDSFESSSRTLLDSLLGEKGVSDQDEKTGYLWLEIKREDREEYLSFGIGMHGSRGGLIKKWFFAIENNQRIGIDIELFEEESEDVIVPFSKKKLKNRMESIGKFFETSRSYKEYINKKAFGFETTERFDELTALIINLRNPKLSKSFSPDVIYTILKDSLPVIKEEDLYPLSRTIEQIDNHREKLEELDYEVEQLKKFTKTYQNWHKEYVAQLAGKWLFILNKKQKLSELNTEYETSYHTTLKELDDEKKTYQLTMQRLDVLDKEIDSLKNHESVNLISRGVELERQIQYIKRKIARETAALSQKQKTLAQQVKSFEIQTSTITTLEQDLNDYINDNDQYVELLNIEDLNAYYVQKIQKSLTKDEFNYWKQQIVSQKHHYENVITHIQQSEKLEMELTEEKRHNGKLEAERDRLNNDLKQWQDNLVSEVENFKKEFEKWLHSSPINIDKSSYSDVLHQVTRLEEEDLTQDLVLERLRLSYLNTLSDVQLDQYRVGNRLNEVDQETLALEEEVKTWKENRSPEPHQSESRKDNRERNKGKSYISFFKAVDFIEECDEELKANLEGALYASGILDSLISNDGLTLSDDKQITADPQMFTNTLLDYLKVNDELNPELQELTANILQSILINTDEVTHLPVINTNGTYKIATLHGEKPLDYIPSYIGFANQESYRQRKIMELENELASIASLKKQLQLTMEQCQDEERKIEESYLNKPTLENIYQAKRYINNVEADKKHQSEYLRKSTEKLNQLTEDEKRKKQELLILTKDDNLKLTQQDYRENLRYATNYEANLNDIQLVFDKLKMNLLLKKQTAMSIEDIKQDEAKYLMEIGEWNKEKEETEALLLSNKEQVKLANIEDIQEKLSLLQKEKEEKRISQKERNERINQKGIDLSNIKHKTETNQKELVQVESLENLWSELFKSTQKNGNIELERSLEEGAKELAKESNVKALRSLEERIFTEFDLLKDSMRNYYPQKMSLTVVDLEGYDRETLGDFEVYNQTNQIKFTLYSKSVYMHELYNELESNQITLRHLLNKEDETLFKNTILDSLGYVLRNKINEATKWVQNMNEIYKSRQNPAQFSFTLNWKPSASTSENDLGTAKLVSLLQKDPKILSEKDRIAFAKHCLEKVNDAQEQLKMSLKSDANDNGNNTLFQAIESVLDYRDWFDFEIKYKKANEGYQPRVLTADRMKKFSAGEKAMTMMLPLMAALYSRYSEASPFALKVMTLDEAFAGVDEFNTSDLYQIMESFDFNYIINSQILDGTDKNIPKINIYELLRPQNLNLVTSTLQIWDGKVLTDVHAPE